MQPLVPAIATPESIAQTRKDLIARYQTDAAFAAQFPGDMETFTVQADAMIERAQGEQYRNDIYHVVKMPVADDWVHLSIKRHDRCPIHDWRDLQAIKNQLVGEECEGMELLPAESRLVDSANQYHLWCCTDSAFRFPFGFQERLVLDNPPGKAKNRSFAGGFARSR